MKKLLASLLLLLIIFSIDFALFSAIIYAICFFLGIVFTWKMSLGIWLVVILFKLCFKDNK